MFTLQAYQTTTLLPNPQFSDAENLVSEIESKRARDGTLYTYVKTKGDRRRLQWTFALTRNKALELRAFILSYFASKVRITDHNGVTWLGNFTDNPFEFDTIRRAAPAICPMPRGEQQQITLTFEGVEQ